METIKLIINGKVQGVWYRKSTKEKADELGLNGTVKNLPNGQVEIMVQGDTVKIQDLISWARVGPKYAEVQSIEKESVLEPPQYLDFTIIR